MQLDGNEKARKEWNQMRKEMNAAIADWQKQSMHMPGASFVYR